MTKEEKLKILDNLILRANKATYQTKLDMIRCKDDIKSFVRNVFAKENNWIDRIDSIKWSVISIFPSTSESDFERAWNRGKDEFLGVLESIKSDVYLYDSAQHISKSKMDTSKVFIVHGHNDTMKLAVARIIAQLGLTPIILHEQPSKGSTIIEKFERYSEDVSLRLYFYLQMIQ